MNSIEEFIDNLHLKNLVPSDQVKILAHAISEIPWGEARTVEDVLKLNCGTCHGKHLVLEGCLDLLNIQYETVMCTFKWSEQNLNLPNELVNILAEGEWEHGHNFVSIKLDTKFDLDITWNSKLETYGFKTLPTNWEPNSSFVSVNYIKRWDNVDLHSKKQELINELPEEVRLRRERFLKGFIAWINSINNSN